MTVLLEGMYRPLSSLVLHLSFNDKILVVTLAPSAWTFGWKKEMLHAYCLCPWVFVRFRTVNINGKAVKLQIWDTAGVSN